MCFLRAPFSCILLGYQLFTFFNLEDSHQDLQTPELKKKTLRVTTGYDIPHLPRDNPYPPDWLLRLELAKGIREGRKHPTEVGSAAGCQDSNSTQAAVCQFLGY